VVLKKVVMKMSWKPTETKSQPTEVKPVIQFQTLKEAKQDRGIKILSYGNFNTGKTHFALSSKAPVYIIDTENGASPLANKFPDVKVISFPNIDNNNVEEKDEVNNFQKYIDTIDYLVNLPDEEVGTIIIDSVSDIWEWAQAYGKIKIFKLNIEDRLKQQWDWAIINKLYSKPLQKLINKNCNVILTAREGEVYLGPGKPSGIFTPKCQKKTPFMVDVVLYHELKYSNKQINYQCKIDKCRQNGQLIGKVIVDVSLDKLEKLINKEKKE